MTRLGDALDAARTRGRKLLVAYLCMGDPSLDESVELALAAVSGGADVLELGVPFSDPTADGPTIARAASRAIARGTTILGVLEAAAHIRARTNAPLVLFSYYNPILATGESELVELARASGVDALLVVDLPPEESGELRGLAAEAGIAIVPLVAPTSDAARVGTILEAVARDGRGVPNFVYYVSMTGITGAAATALDAARDAARALEIRAGLPVVVGFGIRDAEGARRAAGKGDDGPSGIVVGTELVKRIDAGGDGPARVAAVTAFVAELRAGIDW